MKRLLAAALAYALGTASAYPASILDAATTVYRDYVTDGVPTSGTWNPSKSEIRALWSSLDASLPGLTDSIDGSGNAGLLPGTRGWAIIQRATSTTGRPYALYVERNAGYTGDGGQTGAIDAQCANTAAVTDQLNWCTLIASDNSIARTDANTSGLAVYVRKRPGATHTWGQVVGLIDYNTNSPYAGVSQEIDMVGVGADNNNSRIGIDLAAGCWDPIPTATCTAGAPHYFGTAIRIGYFDGPGSDPANVFIKTAIKMRGNITTAIDSPGFNVAGSTYGTVNIGATHYGAPGTLDGEKIQLLGTPGTLSTGDYSIGVGAGELWLNSGADLTFYSFGSQAGKFTSGTGWAFTGTVTVGSTTLLTTSVALSNAAASATATMTNAPAAGNPTKWISINDNGTIRRIPAW